MFSTFAIDLAWNWKNLDSKSTLHLYKINIFKNLGMKKIEHNHK